MGIPGLKTFVERNGEMLWTKFKLQNTKVILDGSCLYYHLHISAKLNGQCGGQYTEFHELAVSFFNSLKSNSVEAFVVLDGAQEPSERKLDSIIKRKKKKILDASGAADATGDLKNILPLLTRQTFQQTMEELGVKFAVCDREADQEIAYRANLLDCPVISSDSDFFIYDLKQGYIPLEHLDCTSGSIEARLFKSEKLSRHLNIHKDLLPPLASLLGNDYISCEVLSPFYIALKTLIKIQDKILRIATFLLEHRQAWRTSVLNLVPEYNRSKLEQALETSIQSYRHCVRLCHPPLKPWISKIRKGLFPIVCVNTLIIGKQFLRVQVEDFSAVSANQCSLELRRFMYGIMRLEAAENRPHGQGASVIEWDRDGKGLQNYGVQSCDHIQGFGQLPSLRTVPDLEIAERHRLCLTLLESNTDLVLNLPAELQLFAASLRFWIHHAKPSVEESHLRALLICSLRLKEGERLRDVGASKSTGRPHTREFQPSFDLAAQHSFAQWQCVMQEAMDLNLLLQKPLNTPLIRHLYDGLLVQDLVWKLEEGQSAQTLLRSMDKKLFKRLYHIVQGSKSKKCPSAKEKIFVTNVMTSNRFDALAKLDEDDV